MTSFWMASRSEAFGGLLPFTEDQRSRLNLEKSTQAPCPAHAGAADSRTIRKDVARNRLFFMALSCSLLRPEPGQRLAGQLANELVRMRFADGRQRTLGGLSADQSQGDDDGRVEREVIALAGDAGQIGHGGGIADLPERQHGRVGKAAASAAAQDGVARNVIGLALSVGEGRRRSPALVVDRDSTASLR